MTDTESLLNRWQSAGVLDAETAARIRALESETRPKTARAALAGNDRPHPRRHPAGLRRGPLRLCALGRARPRRALRAGAGHGGRLPPRRRLRALQLPSLSTALHAVGTLSAGPAIALVGQIFNIQEHWPTAVLVWAVAALSGWILLQDEAQQTLTLFLVPAWIVSELSYSSATTSATASISAACSLSGPSSTSPSSSARRRKPCREFSSPPASSPLSPAPSSCSPTGPRFSPRKPSFHSARASGRGLPSPHCRCSSPPSTATKARPHRRRASCTRWPCRGVTAPGPKLHLPISDQHLRPHRAQSSRLTRWWLRSRSSSARGACAWASRALVNFGIAGFAAAVGWFYFSDVFTELGRSLGLIGLGVLFLAGGWALEKTRRRILARMGNANAPHLRRHNENLGIVPSPRPRWRCSSCSWRWSLP